MIRDLGAWVFVLVCWWRVRTKGMWPGHPLCAEEPNWFLSKGSQQDLLRSPQQNAGGVWSWVFRARGIACVQVQWFCFGNVLGIIMIPRCSLRSLICLAIHLKILMTSRCICILFWFWGIHFWIPSFKGHLFGDSLFWLNPTRFTL